MEDAQIFAVVAIVIVGLVGSLSFIGVMTARALQRGRRQQLPAVRLVSEERFEQLQHSIDAIAVEVERIAEAQRFTAKLLADRVERTSLAR